MTIGDINIFNNRLELGYTLKIDNKLLSKIDKIESILHKFHHLLFKLNSVHTSGITVSITPTSILGRYSWPSFLGSVKFDNQYTTYYIESSSFYYCLINVFSHLYRRMHIKKEWL